MTTSLLSSLNGKNALILGVANERSLAWGISKALHASGCNLGFNYLGESLERRVRPLAEGVSAKLIAPCDVNDDKALESFFQEAKSAFGGKLDILIHSVAFAQREDLEGRFLDTSREGFHTALGTSAYSLVACARHAEPLMKSGGSIVTLSYYGAEKVVPNYNVMGVAKAALEACTRYLAWDLGPQKIRVNAISAGAVKTLSASGVRNFRTMLSEVQEKTPLKENIHQDDVGALAAFLAADESKHITGSTMYVDSGANIMGV